MKGFTTLSATLAILTTLTVGYQLPLQPSYESKCVAAKDVKCWKPATGPYFLFSFCGQPTLFPNTVSGNLYTCYPGIVGTEKFNAVDCGYDEFCTK